jgi:hypothetical protein
MKDEDINLTLSRDDSIVSSSGFTASVMDALMREATAPPPIPFPWKRALPGVGWCLAAAIAFLTMRPGRGGAPPPPNLHLSTALTAAGWISAALVVALASVVLTFRMARKL